MGGKKIYKYNDLSENEKREVTEMCTGWGHSIEEIRTFEFSRNSTKRIDQGGRKWVQVIREKNK